MSKPNGKIQTERLCAMLETFGLKHVSRDLPRLLDAAETEDQTHRDFLLGALETEVRGRNERRRHRNYTAAHFPPIVRPLEEFDPAELDSGITSGQIKQLKNLSWLDSYGNIILAGPPGLGKTMIAVGLGLHAINEGYTVCFEKMTDFCDILAKADYERSAGFRLKNLQKAQLIILDEIGYKTISREQANRFFCFVSDAYEKSSMIFTTNKEIPDWVEMMGDPVLTTAMMDRILHHSRCFSLKGESYRLKHPEIFASADPSDEK
ncbi:ATPase AAA [Clostridia bacterium]|nr:ATPase AAA [Clostridia bacterium]